MKISDRTIGIVGVIVATLALVISLVAFFLAKKTDADISQIQSLVSDIKNDTTSIKETLTSCFVIGEWFWVSIVVIIVFVVGFFIYMFKKEGGK